MTVFFRLPLLLSCLWRTPEAGSIPPAIFKATRRSARRRTFSTRERAKMHHHAERRPDEYRPVLTALARIDDGVMVESLPLPEVPGARTVNDLRALGANGLGPPPSGVTRARRCKLANALAPVYRWFTEGFDPLDLNSMSCTPDNQFRNGLSVLHRDKKIGRLSLTYPTQHTDPDTILL